MSLRFFQEAVILMLPLIVGGVLHMIVVKLDALSYLKRPLHPSWFGVNKTWRGMILMPLLTVLGVYVARLVEDAWGVRLLAEHSPLALGLTLGLGYALAELPNSLMKRRLGIRPGEMSDHHPWLFSIIDQADSVIGCALVYALWGVGEWSMQAGLILLGTLVHLMLNYLLWLCGVRRHPL